MEACHKDVRRIRLTQARLNHPKSNLLDIMNRYEKQEISVDADWGFRSCSTLHEQVSSR